MLKEGEKHGQMKFMEETKSQERESLKGRDASDQSYAPSGFDSSPEKIHSEVLDCSQRAEPVPAQEQKSAREGEIPGLPTTSDYNLEVAKMIAGQPFDPNVVNQVNYQSQVQPSLNQASQVLNSQAFWLDPQHYNYQGYLLSPTQNLEMVSSGQMPMLRKPKGLYPQVNAAIRMTQNPWWDKTFVYTGTQTDPAP